LPLARKGPSAEERLEQLLATEVGERRGRWQWKRLWANARYRRRAREQRREVKVEGRRVREKRQELEGR